MKKEDIKQKAQKMRMKHQPNIKNVWLKTMILVSLFANMGEAKGVTFESENKENKENTTPTLLNSIYATDNDIEKYLSNEDIKEKLVEDITQRETQELQNQVIEQISQLQSDIKTAKRLGKRTSFIARLFKKVSPMALDGKLNYCAAGAMSAYCGIDDADIKPFVDNMIASKDASPKDFHLSSHPNVSCRMFLSYYKGVLGSNFIDRESPDFQNQLKNLEKGDVIIMYSSQNTSSGLHCVTFEKYENGKIFIKSLNNENDYSIRASQIKCVAKFPNQFRKNFSAALSNNNDLLLSFIKKDPSLYARVSDQSIRIPNESGLFFQMTDKALLNIL